MSKASALVSVVVGLQLLLLWAGQRRYTFDRPAPYPVRFSHPVASPPCTLDPGCPRFFVQRFESGLGSVSAGLGHRFGGVLFAAKQAKEYQATLVIDDGFWRDAGGHGAFPLVRRLLGLYRFMSTSELEALKTQFSPPLKVINVQHRQELNELLSNKSGEATCSVLVNMDAASGRFCEGGVCFDRWPGVYAEMQPMFQALYSPDDTLSALAGGHMPPSNATSRNVVWHLRVSDVRLHANDTRFYTNLLNGLDAAAAAAGVSLAHFVVYGDKDIPDRTSDQPPPGFEFLRALIPGAVYLSSSRPEVDLHRMCSADVLVGSGSSFPIMAATVGPQRLAYIEVPPKEGPAFGQAWKTYHLAPAVVALDDGLLGESEVKKLTKRLLDQDSAASL